MKTLIFTILLFTNVSIAQFNLSTSVGYGISINSKAEYTLFQSVINVSPNYQFDKWQIGASSIAVNSDSNTTMFNGAYVSYQAYKFNEQKNITLSGHYLLGFEGDYLLGGAAAYNIDNFGFDISFSQEYLRRELWIIAGIRYNIIN